MKYLSTLILLTVQLSLFSQSGTYTDAYTGMSFVKVASGSFTMGCTTEQGTDCNNAESPSHQVTLTQDYWLGKYEVTQAQWRKVMGSNPSGIGDCDVCPVENVSWTDIQTFLQKLNAQTGNHFRLPTEAEWEYAARGGTKAKTGTEATKYAGSNNIADIAWYEVNAGNKTHPSGKKQPNELGLYDMSGSVWEWCADWYGAYSTTAVTDPKGPDTGKDRVLRGGGWNAPPEAAQVAFRLHGSPDKTTANAGRAYHDVGLRLCFSLTAEQEIDRTKMKAIKLTGDTGDAYGWVLSNVIDGDNSKGFHSAPHNTINAASTPTVPPYTQKLGMFTIDMGVVAKLSGIKWWQRSNGDHRYNRTNPRFFEIWGTDKLTEDNGASMDTGWELLVKDGEVTKPSGSSRGTTTAEDNAASDKGFDYLIPSSKKAVRYIRFVNKQNWWGYKDFNIMEIKMYGRVEKEIQIQEVDRTTMVAMTGANKLTGESVRTPDGH